MSLKSTDARSFHQPLRGLAPVLAGGVLLAAVLLAGCSNEFDPDEARDIQTITILRGASEVAPRDAFSPDPFTVNRRTEIRWTNRDTVNHQISSVAGIFGSTDPIEPGETYSFLFEDVGTYLYYCEIPGHREQGVINVVP